MKLMNPANVDFWKNYQYSIPLPQRHSWRTVRHWLYQNIQPEPGGFRPFSVDGQNVNFKHSVHAVSFALRWCGH